jgi:hypothetical protein
MNGCSFTQACADQRPKFDSGARKRKSSGMAMTKRVLRPDKRKIKKRKFL